MTQADELKAAHVREQARDAIIEKKDRDLLDERQSNRDLLAALLTADEMLTHIMNGGSYETRDYMDRLYAIRSTIAKEERGQP